MRLSTCDCRFKLFYIGKSNTIFILNKHFVSFFAKKMSECYKKVKD